MAATKFHAEQGKRNRTKVLEYILYHGLTTFKHTGIAIGLSGVTVKKHYVYLVANGKL